MNVEELTDSEIEDIAQQIEESKKLNEETLEEIIGRGLYDEGYEITDEGELIVKPIGTDNNKRINAKMALDHVRSPQPEEPEIAIAKGKRFGKRFKNKLNEFICSNDGIREIFQSYDSIKGVVKKAFAAILTVLGVALNVIWTAVIIAILALVIKTGYEAYCEI